MTEPSKAFKADLHCHTTCSDGTCSPEQILHLAKASNLTGLSITDHESIKAYREAVPLAKTLGIELISGAEFSAVQKKVSVHVLAYAFPLQSPIIAEFCQKHQFRRTNRNRSILELLKKHGMEVTEEEVFNLARLENLPTIGRPHIALAMIKRGYVSTVQEAFKKYLGEECCCYAPGESFSVEETIDLIHQAHGLAFIAHPHLIDDAKTLQALQELNFDGLEAYYANFTNDKNQRWIKMAQKKGWLITGGSDFHGEIKPRISLGASFTPEETFNVLLNHYRNSHE